MSNEIQNSKVQTVLTIGSAATNATSTGQIDCLEFDHCFLLISAGIGTSTSAAFTSITISEADVATTSSAVAIAALTLGTVTTTAVNGIIPLVNTSVGIVQPIDINLVGRKRYLLLSITPALGLAAIPFNAVAVLTRGKVMPANAANSLIAATGQGALITA